MEASSGTFTSELFGFTTSGVGNEEGLVVLEEEFLKFSLFGFILEFLVEGDDALADSLTDGHYLSCGTTTSDANADVEVGESVGTEEEDGLVDFHSHASGFDEFDGLSVNSDETLSVGNVSDSSGVLLSSEALSLVLF